MGRFLFISACQSQPETSSCLLTAGQLTDYPHLFANKAIELFHFPSANAYEMLSYSSVRMPVQYIQKSALKWKGRQPPLMLCAAGGTQKPHPRHSQETHKDPTGRYNLTHTAVNSTVFAFRSGAVRQEAQEDDPQHCIDDCKWDCGNNAQSHPQSPRETQRC